MLQTSADVAANDAVDAAADGSVEATADNAVYAAGVGEGLPPHVAQPPEVVVCKTEYVELPAGEVVQLEQTEEPSLGGNLTALGSAIESASDLDVGFLGDSQNAGPSYLLRPRPPHLDEAIEALSRSRTPSPPPHPLVAPRTSPSVFYTPRASAYH